MIDKEDLLKQSRSHLEKADALRRAVKESSSSMDEEKFKQLQDEIKFHLNQARELAKQVKS